MTWAKIDDRANEHRKQLAAGPEACWLWVCGLLYCKRQSERDGFIPEEAVSVLYPNKRPARLADALVRVGLWEKVEGGYHVHEYELWNPTKEQIEADKAAGRARAAASYARKRSVKNYHSSGEEKANKEDSSSEETTKKSNSSEIIPRARAQACDAFRDPRSEIRDPGEEETPPSPLVSCPTNLRLNAAQRSVMEMNMGMQPWQIDALEAEYLAKNLVNGNTTKPIEAWQKCLAKAITSEWNSGHRPKKPVDESQRAKETDGLQAF